MGEGKGQEDTPRQAKEIIMWGPSVGVINMETTEGPTRADARG